MASLTAAIPTAAVVLQLGGGASGGQIPGMPGPGPVTPWALPATRVLTDVAAVATAGLLLAAAALGPIASGRPTQVRTVEPHAYRWVRAAGWTALAWFIATALGIGYTASDILGRPLHELIADPRIAGSALNLPPVPGLLVAAGLVALLTVACRFVLSRAGVVLLLGIALAATLPAAFGGHSGGGTGDHRLAISAMLVHVVGVVLWAGGLLALARAHRLSTPDLDRAVRRYSLLADCAGAAIPGHREPRSAGSPGGCCSRGPPAVGSPATAKCSSAPTWSSTSRWPWAFPYSWSPGHRPRSAPVVRALQDRRALHLPPTDTAADQTTQQIPTSVRPAATLRLAPSPTRPQTSSAEEAALE